MWRRLAFFLSLCLPAAACSNSYVLTDSARQITLGPALPGTVVELSACGACVFGEPDQVFAVPPNFAQINFYRLSSLDGGYYHKPGTCDCFVGEVWMYFNSNIQPYPDGNPERVVVTGSGFDTPSSSGYGQTVPTTQEDCQRYYRATRMWEKKEGTDTWSQIGKQINTGTWSGGSGGSCNIGSAMTYSPFPSNTNQARKVRVAVKVLVRETAQKAAVETSQPPPK
ncbi:hypothetical protein [Pelagibius marinus]|uniref:hypothetical protein n=1 Tax=Pelagibius marinus TaxID=2762760 RepID=UPI00187239D2|nr:hypothetical protein [Pelagibius marinus]